MDSFERTLWSAYDADRSNLSARDALVAHYFSWAKRTATRMASNAPLVDRENAVAEALAQFALQTVAKYDSARCKSFEGFAALCLRRSLTDTLRRQKAHPQLVSIDDVGERPSLAELLPARTNSNCDHHFCEMTAKLPTIEALCLWLRYYRQTTIAETADILNLSKSGVKNKLHRGLKALRLERQNPEVG